jgi:hypothetical protein
MTDILDAILAIKSDAKVMVNDENINTITWHDSNPTKITKKQILDKQAELQSKYDALDFARAREQEYPALKEFAEAYCEKEIGEDSTKWDAYVIKYNLVRSNNPKPKE